MKSKWPHFSKEELSCHGTCAHCSGSDERMNNRFMGTLEAIRADCGFALPVSSGYRCPQYNAKVSHTGINGPHTTGKAVDIVVSGQEAYILIGVAMAHGIKRIGVNQKGPMEKRFIHLDDADSQCKPWIWTY